MNLTREFFANYKYLGSMIKSMERRLKYFENHPLALEYGVVRGSMGVFPYTECHFVVSGASVKSTSEREDTVKQLIIDLTANKRLYEDMKLDIESFVENTELFNLEERTIFRLKFIDDMKDREIGEELGYDRSTISKKIEDILNKIPESYSDTEIHSMLRQVSPNSHS